MKAKVYIYRIVNQTGRKEYKRTKCTDAWTAYKTCCWQFSEQGAKKIVETYQSHCVSNYYTYGYEIAE